MSYSSIGLDTAPWTLDQYRSAAIHSGADGISIVVYGANGTNEQHTSFKDEEAARAALDAIAIGGALVFAAVVSKKQFYNIVAEKYKAPDGTVVSKGTGSGPSRLMPILVVGGIGLAAFLLLGRRSK